MIEVAAGSKGGGGAWALGAEAASCRGKATFRADRWAMLREREARTGRLRETEKRGVIGRLCLRERQRETDSLQAERYRPLAVLRNRVTETETERGIWYKLRGPQTCRAGWQP